MIHRYNASDLSTLIKEETGKSFVQLLTEYRLNRAAVKLREGRKSHLSKEESWGRTSPFMDRCPKTESGTPEKAAFLCNCKALDLSDELKINILEAYGIPCLRDYPEDGSFGKVVIGMSGQGTDIYVPESMLEEVKGLLEAEEIE